MQYIIAFFIFLIIINVIGFIFSFLWPFIVALVIVVAILNLLAYRRHKKAMQEFYEENGNYQQDGFDSFYREDRTSSQADDVIDVEFSETDVDE